VRHGQSTWNLENIFTGWTDVPLTEKGRAEAATAGELMADETLSPDVLHTSVLERAVDTANIALLRMGRSWIPVARHWRLNERHYGALQGENKQATTDTYGTNQVNLWRRSYDTPPPPVSVDDHRHPSRDERYASLPPDVLPSTECLADVVDRMLPYWHDAIVPDLVSGRTVLVVAHGNSLRALVKHLDHIPDDDISELNIPTGIPMYYRLSESLGVLDRRYLGDADEARAAAAAVAAQAGTA
jgi:2,3-bisphosphoglycerate-dependent phosphoglycerate mutase